MWGCGGWGVWEVGWVSEGGEGGGMPIKTFRGFGTERARLGTFKKNPKKMLFFYSKRAKTRAKPEV